jgi:hypothetical protein
LAKNRRSSEPVHDKARHNASIRMTGDVGEATEHSVMSEHPIAGPGAAAHRVQDGEPDGEHDRL